jgi:hypothetical protein
MAIAEFMMLFSMFAMIVLTLTVIVAVAASCCYGDDR